MDGESHGGEAAEVELAEGQEDAQAQQQAEVGAVASSDSGYEAQLARRDERIAELEAQVAEAAASKEAADALRSEIEAVTIRRPRRPASFAPPPRSKSGGNSPTSVAPS